MGCWNHTCALSNLPVLAGESVYVFLLQEGKFYGKYIGNHCHPHNYYSPLPFFFEGEYDDYGSVEKCHGKLLDSIILPSIKDKLVEFEVGENQYHDIEVKKDKFDINQLFQADHESRLFVTPDDFTKSHKKDIARVRLTHIVVRKNILDAFLKDYTFETWKNQNIGKPTSEYYCKAQFQDIVNSGNKFIKTVRKDIKKGDMEPILNICLSFCSGGKENYFSQSIFNYSESRPDNNIFNLNKIITENINNKEIVNEIVYQLSVHNLLNVFMNNARRMWIKPSGCGSQNSDTDSNKFLAKLVLEEAEKIDHHWDEV